MVQRVSPSHPDRFIINDMYRSELCLLYLPHMITIAAIYLTLVGRACSATLELVRDEEMRIPALRQPCMYILIYLISMLCLLAHLCCLPYSMSPPRE